MPIKLTAKVTGRSFFMLFPKAGVGGYVIGNKDKKILWRVESINGKKIKLKAIYTFQENRSSNRFMLPNSCRPRPFKSANKIEDFYILQRQNVK
jgi:hypothetical protein